MVKEYVKDKTIKADELVFLYDVLLALEKFLSDVG
jgi:hypothetical protein